MRDSDHLNKELDRVEKLGGEGLMLRLPGSKWVPFVRLSGCLIPWLDGCLAICLYCRLVFDSLSSSITLCRYEIGRSWSCLKVCDVDKPLGASSQYLLLSVACLHVSHRLCVFLQVKTFHDAEALVVGHETGKGKHGDRLGALYVSARAYTHTNTHTHTHPDTPTHVLM